MTCDEDGLEKRRGQRCRWDVQIVVSVKTGFVLNKMASDVSKSLRNHKTINSKTQL